MPRKEWKPKRGKMLPEGEIVVIATGEKCHKAGLLPNGPRSSGTTSHKTFQYRTRTSENPSAGATDRAGGRSCPAFRRSRIAAGLGLATSTIERARPTIRRTIL